MRLVVKDKDSGYWGRELWLPKSKINVRAVTNCLTFPLDDIGNVLQAFREERHHVVVPRETFRLGRFKFPIYDVRGREFEQTDFQDCLVPRDDVQRRAWEALQATEGGVLNLSCGRGKSGLALKKGAQLGGPILIVVTNTATLEGWLEEIDKWLGVPRERVGIIKQSRFEWDCPVAIATIQTLAKKAHLWPPWFRDRWKLIILDEVHHTSARVFSQVLPLFQGMRLGLTATVERDDGLESLYLYHVGKVFFADLTQDLPAKIHFVQTASECDMSNPGILDVTGQFNIGKFRSWLGMQSSRNHLIQHHVTQAVTSGRKVLALSHSVAHVEALSEAIPGSAVIHGGVKYDKRLERLRTHCLVFATPGCAEEALNDPALDTMMFLTPYKVWRTFQQGVGRIQRPFEGKKKPLVVLFEDVQIPPCRAMYMKLRGKMRRRGYEFTTVPTRRRP